MCVHVGVRTVWRAGTGRAFLGGNSRVPAGSEISSGVLNSWRLLPGAVRQEGGGRWDGW